MLVESLRIFYENILNNLIYLYFEWLSESGLG